MCVRYGGVSVVTLLLSSLALMGNRHLLRTLTFYIYSIASSFLYLYSSSSCSSPCLQFTVLLVGYFVLGPSDLYKLTKEIGKFVQNIRTLGDDLTTTLETNMESQLQLEEIRKAQRELNDAFSFRRSINTDDTGDAFSTTVDSPRPGVTAVQDDDATTTAVVAEDDNDAGDAGSGGRSSVSQGGTTTKKKIRRRVKRKAATPTEEGSYNGNVPTDLDMPSAANKGGEDRYADRPQDPFIEFTDEEQKKIDQEFDQYVSLGDDDDKDPTGSKDGWFGGDSSATDGDAKPTLAAGDSQQQQQQATSRFQQQLSGDWNAQVMANEDRLEPLAKVMQLLASLEEEKISSTKRLEEEFRRRAEVEEEYYQKQRKLLEDAAAQVQQATAGSTTTTTTSTTSSQTSTNSKR